MARVCTACFVLRPTTTMSTPFLALCDLCADELDEYRLRGQASLSPFPEGNLRACFEYRGLLRRLVLRAKVRGDQRATDLLLDLCVKHPSSLSLCQTADVLVAAPSSLWGRLRGRFDLAMLLALHLGTRHSLPVLPAPAHLYWRMTKSARLSREQRAKRASILPPRLIQRAKENWRASLRALGPNPRLLLIDDIVTTGLTLKTTAAAMLDGEAPLSLQMLVMASSDGRKMP